MATYLWDGLNDGQQQNLGFQTFLENEEDEDLFQCGKCKSQFTSLPEFVSHKKKSCSQLKLHTTKDSHVGNVTVSVAHAPTAVSYAGLSAGSSFSTNQKVDSQSAGNQVLSNHALQGTNYQITDDLFSAIDPISNMRMKFAGSSILNQIGSSYTEVTENDVGLGENAGQVFQTYIENSPDTVDTLLDTNSAAPDLLNIPLSVVQLAQQQQMIFTPSSVSGQLIYTLLPAQTGKDGTSASQEPQFVLAYSAPTEEQTTSSAEVADNVSIQGAATPITPVISTTAAKPQTEELPAKKVFRNWTDKKSPNKGGKLKCSHCGKSFNKNFDLQQHVRSHTGEKPFQCIVCGRAFAQKSNVKKHMRTHKVWPQGNKSLPEEPFQLEPVSKDTETVTPTRSKKISVNTGSEDKHSSGGLWTLITPSTSEGEPDTGRVVIVNVTKTSDSDTRETKSGGSVKFEVLVDNSYKCQFCGLKLPTYFKLKSHLMKHKDKQVYRCTHESCTETFAELDAFLEHFKIHESEMEYRCHICAETFTELYDLGVHQYTHDKDKDGQTQVDSETTAKAGRNNVRPFLCTQCGSRYATQSALHNHMATTSHRYRCKLCYKVFPYERLLRRHLTVHSSKANYPCKECGKAFKSSVYLRQHMMLHDTNKRFVCTICSRAFNRSDKLRRHSLVHDKTRKYKCPFRAHTGCEWAFNRADKLRAHIVSHSAIKPFSCHLCNKQFSRRPHLVEHVRVHEGDFKYHCELCGKGFNRRNVLRLHTEKCSAKEQTTSSNDVTNDVANDNSQSESPNSDNVKVKPNRRRMERIVKRKVGRPRRIYTEKELEALRNKPKRPRGRPRKNYLTSGDLSNADQENSDVEDQTDHEIQRKKIEIRTDLLNQDSTASESCETVKKDVSYQRDVTNTQDNVASDINSSKQQFLQTVKSKRVFKVGQVKAPNISDDTGSQGPSYIILSTSQVIDPLIAANEHDEDRQQQQQHQQQQQYLNPMKPLKIPTQGRLQQPLNISQSKNLPHSSESEISVTVQSHGNIRPSFNDMQTKDLPHPTPLETTVHSVMMHPQDGIRQTLNDLQTKHLPHSSRSESEVTSSQEWVVYSEDTSDSVSAIDSIYTTDVSCEGLIQPQTIQVRQDSNGVVLLVDSATQKLLARICNTNMSQEQIFQEFPQNINQYLDQ